MSNAKSTNIQVNRLGRRLVSALCVVALGGCSGIPAEDGVGTTHEEVVSTTVFAPMAFSTKLGSTGKVLAVTGESLSNGASVVTWDDAGSPDQYWRLVDVGSGNFNILNQNSQQVIAVSGVNPAPGTPIVQWPNPDQSWHFVDQNDGFATIVNNSTQKPFGIQNQSQTRGTPILEWNNNATPDQEWRPLPKGNVRIKNVNSKKVMAVVGAQTDAGINVVQYADTGTTDQSWQFIPNGGNDGNFRIRDAHSQKFLALQDHLNKESQPIVQMPDDGFPDELWRLRYETTTGRFRIQNAFTKKVLAIVGASKEDSINVVQTDDTGTLDHVWEFLTDPNIDMHVSLQTFQTTDLHLCGTGHGVPGHDMTINFYNMPTANNGAPLSVTAYTDGTVQPDGTYIWRYNNWKQVVCSGSQSSQIVTVSATDATTQLSSFDTIPAAYFCQGLPPTSAYQGGCSN